VAGDTGAKEVLNAEGRRKCTGRNFALRAQRKKVPKTPAPP